MFDFFHITAQKSMAAVAASAASLVGIFLQPNIVLINPAQPIEILPAPTSTEQTAKNPQVGELKVPVRGSDYFTILMTKKKSKIGDIAIVSQPEKPQPAAVTNQPEQPQSSAAAPPPPAPEAPKTFDPSQTLDRTSFYLNQMPSGDYSLVFRTDTGGSTFDWDPSDQAIGGTASVPKMNVSFSCDPSPTNLPDQRASFRLNTSYACDITLTDSLMRPLSKRISFTTGAGRLVVKSSNLSTFLKSGQSDNGFVLDNQSDETITVSDLTFDVSFVSLNTSSPIILRLINPNKDSSFDDFQVQDFPADPSKPSRKSRAGMKASLSFVLEPHKQILLPVRILGVQPLLVVGVNAEFNVTLKQLNTDKSQIKTVFFSPTISWSCIPYDPLRSQGALPNEQNCK